MNVNYVYGIIFLFLTSCLSPTDRVIPSLLRADSLIEVGCADSALSLLERMNLAELSSIQSRASYALLLTQAKDQNYVTHTDDSLIRVAVDYYDTSDDITLRAKAHYYLGRVCQDRGDIEGTVREFLVAMPLAEKAENYDLNILLKSNLGLLFWRHGLQEEADSLYRQAVELAEAHHDSLRLAVVLVHCADICMERGEEYYTDAEKYLKRALKLVKDTEHTEELVFSSLSYLLEYQGKSREAILYANKGMRLVLDSSERYGYYLVIGSAYLQLEQYDSAFVYLNRGIPSDNYYAKTNAYMKLSEMAMRLGKQNEALEYETLYTIYKDSMKLVEQPVEVVSSLKDVLYRQSTERYESFLTRYRFCLLLFVLLFIITIYFFLQRRRKRKKEIARLVDKRQLLYKSIEAIKKELEEKKLEIKEIQQHCECLESDVNSKVQLDSCLNELLEQYHSMQEDLERRLVERDEEVRRLRNLNLKFILMSSPIYQMLIALCEYNKLNPDGMKKITNDEWVILLHEIDMASLGFVERLSTEYEYLLEEDIRFCCLVRLDFKYADIAYLWGCTSAAVYKRSWSVLEKMGLNKDKKVKLVDILRKV
jgi:tetratricopeptide (TPR) repeat protein